jgi:hypothetical protein
MPLDFLSLCPQVERVIDRTARIYQSAQGMFLTEEDLRGRLIYDLQRLPTFRKPRPSQDRHIYATPVHAQLSWYDEDWKLSIVPDITILEPEHLSILHGYEPLLSPPYWSASTPQRRFQRRQRVIDPFIGSGSLPSRSRSVRPLPSKQFEFGGNAITLELKFAREGVNSTILKEVKKDFNKMKRLFGILDSRDEGHTIFSYIVVFDKYQLKPSNRAFTSFLRANDSSYRHKLIYKAGILTKPHSIAKY